MLTNRPWLSLVDSIEAFHKRKQQPKGIVVGQRRLNSGLIRLAANCGLHPFCFLLPANLQLSPNCFYIFNCDQFNFPKFWPRDLYLF